MKKSSLIIKNEHGVILPYVLFITAFICMFIMTAIHSYRHDTALTHRHIQQIKIETLFQMGYETVKSEIIEQEPPPVVRYHFPDGDVKISITPAADTMYQLSFSIKTNEYDTIYTFTKTHIAE